jgi:hypothetical protein
MGGKAPPKIELVTEQDAAAVSGLGKAAALP